MEKIGNFWQIVKIKSEKMNSFHVKLILYWLIIRYF